MNGKLKVKNFGVLKDIDININDFTIIIGSQAQGKSLLAKLVYFFNSLEDIHFELQKDLSLCIQEIKEQLFYKFNKIFPNYFIEQIESFNIKFLFNEKIYIEILKKDDLIISISEKFIENIDTFIKKDNPLNTYNYKQYNQIDLNLFLILNSSKEKNSSLATFIPAGRSYFSNLEKNIFSLINRGLSIEKLILQFGSDFENSKEINVSEVINLIDKNNILKPLINELISGDFYFDKNQAWIDNKISKVKLNDSSSGQQELFPMILVLLYKIFNYSNFLSFEILYNSLLIIEEPEAHLFPKYQYKITELFVLLYNLTKNNKETNKNSFFITTHSPYILSAINNFIQANNTFEELKKKDKKVAKNKVSKIISEDKWLNFEKVSCYLISEGKAKNIMNKETKLIDANIIDEISNEIASQFSSLLELEFDE